MTLPEWLNENLFKWIANNGLATVFVVLVLGVIVAPLLALLRYVIRDAVAHFNTRLDTMVTEQAAAYRDLASSIRHLDGTLDKLGNQTVANHEAINTVLLFISHTQAEVVAHRTIVEGQIPGTPPDLAAAAIIPTPPATMSQADPT